METVKEIREKRTDKVKKRTFGGFYAEYGKWDLRGKSSKELKLMFQDVRNCVTHQLVRIKKLKYVLELYKKRDATKKLISQKRRTQEQIHKKNLILKRLRRRDDHIDSLDKEVDELELQIKNQDREISKLNRELLKKDELIQDVKAIKRKKVIKKVDKPLSPAAKKLEKIANSGASIKALNNLEYVTRTAKFCKEKRLTLDYLSIITQVELLGNIKSKDVDVSYIVLNKLVDRGYLAVSPDTSTSAKYWFVSLEGKQLIKDYKNYLSYGKSILT